MNTLFRTSVLPLILLTLAGCVSQGRPPPEPPKPVEVITVPEPLPMVDDAKPTPEPADETVRVSKANAEARIAPTREGYVNAIQGWPFTDGALYQVYAAPGRWSRESSRTCRAT